jgi:hypothetical protein
MSTFNKNKTTKINSKQNLAILPAIINSNADHVRIRYYQSFQTKHKIDDEMVFEIKPLDTSIKKNIISHLKSIKSVDTQRNLQVECILGTFSEYGINDTYVRISNILKDKDNQSSEKKSTRNFFRRKVNVILLDDLSNNSSNNYTDVIVLEFYYMCDEDNLPYVSTYHHENKYSVTTYNIDPESAYGLTNSSICRICFTQACPAKSQSFTDPDLGTDTDCIEYMDINTDINTDIQKTTFKEELNDFIESQLNSFFDVVSIIKDKF